MPTFKFECQDCNYEFTKLLPAGTKETKCLKCGSNAKKLLSAPVVHFKGGGFYASSNSTKEQKKEEKTACSTCPKKKKCEKD